MTTWHLARLHLVSRRAPAALIALAVCAAVLWPALRWRWGASAAVGQRQLALLIEAGAAAAIAVTTYNPFGEAERAVGRRLPWLRLGTALALTAAAAALLAIAATGGQLPGGATQLVRDLAGATGLGLICATVLGGLLAWVGPVAYTLVAEFALTGAWTSPWLWPARPPHDRGAAICAGLVFAAGLALMTLRGAKD
ncbi:MAG TPA: hypothetical protein VFB06_27065 [Streptosporangiaceae bacterium]|nr:hypothetical protein [Streptosporangiaceae bacterium]